ncbi:MAG TPA: hypothetical protein VF049_22065 [Nocardioidaceae bacterium]
MTDPEPYPWVRRTSERGQAYAAFREYLNLGPRRTVRAAADAAGISADSAYELSKRHGWNERATAYDQHLASAATDGLASQMASARDGNIEFADQMRGHAVTLLEDYIRERAVPSANFSQFVLAIVRLEEHAFRLKDDPKTSAAKDRVNSLLERLDKANQT